MSEVTKITVNLTNENVKSVERLAADLQINKTIVINKAIRLEEMMQDAVRKGGKIMIEDKDGRVRELVLR